MVVGVRLPGARAVGRLGGGRSCGVRRHAGWESPVRRHRGGSRRRRHPQCPQPAARSGAHARGPRGAVSSDVRPVVSAAVAAPRAVRCPPRPSARTSRIMARCISRHAVAVPARFTPRGRRTGRRRRAGRRLRHGRARRHAADHARHERARRARSTSSRATTPSSRRSSTSRPARPSCCTWSTAASSSTRPSSGPSAHSSPGRPARRPPSAHPPGPTPFVAPPPEGFDGRPGRRRVGPAGRRHLDGAGRTRPTAAGGWFVGCHIPGHWQKGMVVPVRLVGPDGVPAGHPAAAPVDRSRGRLSSRPGPGDPAACRRTRPATAPVTDRHHARACSAARPGRSVVRSCVARAGRSGPRPRTFGRAFGPWRT